MAAVKDVEEIRSTSKQGVSLVEVKFDWGKDMDQAETDVRRKLEMIEALLPQDADDSIVFAFDLKVHIARFARGLQERIHSFIY